jgi:hypothetical protein
MVLTIMRCNELPEHLRYCLGPHSTITVRIRQDGFTVVVLGKFDEGLFLLSFVLFWVFFTIFSWIHDGYVLFRNLKWNTYPSVTGHTWSIHA